jgi:CheY-like chemotaxis protein
MKTQSVLLIRSTDNSLLSNRLGESVVILRILIVDDEPQIHEVMDTYLRRFLDDFEIISASNGQEAVTKAETCIQQGHPPDFVLMDMKMPEMDGLECTRTLTSLGVSNIHLLTAYFDTESMKQAVEVGAKGVLKKSEGFALIAKKVADMVRGTREPAPVSHSI